MNFGVLGVVLLVAVNSVDVGWVLDWGRWIWWLCGYALCHVLKLISMIMFVVGFVCVFFVNLARYCLVLLI